LIPKPTRDPNAHPLIGRWEYTGSPVIIWDKVTINSLEAFHAWKAIPGEERVFQTYEMAVKNNLIMLRSGGFTLRGTWSVDGYQLRLKFPMWDNTLIFSRQ
jgi:hypothetical protein